MAVAAHSISLAEVRAAAARIRPYVRRTPTMELVGARQPLPWSVSLKLELLQVTGSFKPRGALNRMLQLPETERLRGVVTASGGNHGQGVAYAGHVLGVPSHVYVPITAPQVKVNRIRGWGAEVHQVGEVYHHAYLAALEHAERGGLPYLHAYADRDVVIGQATTGLEFLEDHPNLEALLVAVGGGGLIAGIAAYAGQASPGTRILGVEPEGAATLYRALEAGQPVALDRLTSYASDALGATSVGEINLALAQRYVERVVLVTDDEIRAAQRYLWEEVRLVAEPGGAAALAALLSGRVEIPHRARVGVLVCGSNASLSFP